MHKFEGEDSGTGETCLALIDGVKCYQRESHPIHDQKVEPKQKKDEVADEKINDHKFMRSPSGADVCLDRTEGKFCRQPAADHEQEEPLGTEDGSYRVTVEVDGETALDWQGLAENVSDALSKALDAREDKVRGTREWRAGL